MSTRSTSKILVAGLVIAWAAACSDARDEEPSEVQLAAGPLPRRPGANVKNLPDFLKCMNDNLKKGDAIDKAVACLPAGCTITLVMSESSAQPGCAPPKGAQKCQLPRVLLACGDPKFEPSFTLCPTSSEGGMQRIEVCQAMPGTDDTEMADISAFANGYDPAVATLKQVLSMPNDDDTGTKGCNGNCHLHEKGKRTDDKNNVVNTGVNGGLLSTRVAPDVNKVIFTTDPAVKAAIEKAKKDGEYAQLEGTKDEELASICKCIDENKDKEPFTKESGKLALDLCNALLSNVGGAGGGAGGAGGASGASGRGGSGGTGEGGGVSVDAGNAGEGGTQSNDTDSGTAAGSGGSSGSLGVFDASSRASVQVSQGVFGF